ncbi:DJ-1/PfpI family protein [Kamptonema cortianum]|nr:DJ-1/PfpI family protein [Oscillatoria laete-virens]MDK3159952.1 DJ-1/PfpI family protein [Kamptonema cortianum]MDL5047174.1 DJ-1/PfpI family protein [Oscillatoria amoena NRMC-F 0135]MDL5055493.1 DJ-1/PfpI family protein [Oscillatoria laete-virens NRMC-F 0139]
MLFHILLFDGFDELDAIAPYEVLRMAARHVPDWKVEFVAVAGANCITAANGLVVAAPRKLLSSEQKPDLLIIPGGGWVDASAVGARAVANCAGTLARLRDMHQSGVILASVCTGAMILATAGLLDGRPCITHHSALDDLKKFPVQIVPQRVIDDGDILTAGGITSGLDLALHLIERFASPALAAQMAATLEYSR